MLIKSNFMKKLLLSIILVFSIFVVNAQRYGRYNNNYYNHYQRPIIGQSPYYNTIINSQPNRIESSILPSLIGAMVGSAIINSINNKQHENCNNSRETITDEHYENQLELERLEIIKKELEIKEMKKRYRKEHGFRLFHKNH